MKTRLLATIISILASNAFADEAVSKQFLEATKIQTESRTRSIESEMQRIVEYVETFSNPRNVRFGNYQTAIVTGTDNGKKTLRLETANRESLREYIDKQKAHYAALKAELLLDFVTPYLDMNEMHIGAIGFPTEMSKPRSLPVLQVISDDRVLIDWGNQPFIFEGQDFSGVVDGQDVLPTSICLIDRTETYTTAIGGTRTVFVMRALSKEELEDAVHYRRDNWPDKPTRMRTWTDTTGSFSVEAELVSTSRGKVTLKKKDGSEVTLPITKLSMDDKLYAKKHADPW